ncbi:DUF2336 domain-containing protein [Bradyrhizobium lablabi]|uniref:DUF2336 domain-containing protein n=1 Tax=Bradyrhizobium lablabi TaxID=722472 RepID=UPI001BA67DE8|nr:DUF2336 domain-containing protein [Bradyrhizobium lablabi]MBR1122288.1 DUF2336 domain-containing protein [Bradyrhizobium lablabi]
MRQVTGLFLSDAARLNERQIDIFDDVMLCLLEQVETQTLIHLSTMLAEVPLAPREATRRLACHEEADVAAPVLRHSQSLSEGDLIEVAACRSQQHLLAIANRTDLGTALTDALLMRADTNVCRALAGNPGARFSDPGYSTLAARAERDEAIADSLASRPDTPAALLDELFARAAKPVRTRLLTLAPAQARGAMRPAGQRNGPEAGSNPREPIDYSEAKAVVLALNNEGKLADQAVNRFAVRQERQNLVAALSLLATVEPDIIEPLIEQSDGYGLMIACRASRLNWNTTQAVLSHRKNATRLPPQEMARRRDAFEALPLSIAQWTIRFDPAADFAAKLGLIESADNGSGAQT